MVRLALETGWVSGPGQCSPEAAWVEPVRILVCRGHETITEITTYDGHDSDQKEPEPESADGLVDQLLAQMQNKDAESILGESGLAGQLNRVICLSLIHRV